MIAMAKLCSPSCVSEKQYLWPSCVPLWWFLRNTIAMATPPIFPFLYLPCPKTRGTILSAPKRQIGSGSTFTKASSSERASHLQKRRCSTFTSKTSQKGGLWYLTPPQTLSNPICKNGIYNRVFFCRAPYILLLCLNFIVFLVFVIFFSCEIWNILFDLDIPLWHIHQMSRE